MAAYTSTGISKHATLTAATIDVVTLNDAYPYVMIVNRDTTNPIWATVDTGPASQHQQAPIAAADGTYYIAAGGVLTVADDSRSSGTAGSNTQPTTVRLISTGAAAYSVTGLNTAQ